MVSETIAGKPVEWWEGVMDECARQAEFNGGQIAGIIVRDFDRRKDEGRLLVTDGRMPNDFRGIRRDGTRIESAHLVREGRYGPFPGKWGKAE